MSGSSEGLFSGIFASGEAAAAVSDPAWLEAMLEFEAALARACAAAGLIPPGAGEEIASACRAERFDAAEIGRAGAESAQPVVALVAALRRQVGGDAAAHVHFGATSQDVLDSAAMLVSRRALESIGGDAAAAADGLAELAQRHAATPMLGRTLLQPAQPTTFGLVAAGWMSGLDRARAALEQIGRDGLPVQLGGPVGALTAYGARGPEVVEHVARSLDLPVPALPWHGDRTPVAMLASACATLAGAAGKLGRDVTLLAQAEVGEVRERPSPGRGGSSSMQHKRNPVAAVCVVACAVRVPALAATLQAGMAGELQRAAGVWQAEAETLSDLLRLTGAATAWSAELVQRLEVDAERMHARIADAAFDPSCAVDLVQLALAAR